MTKLDLSISTSADRARRLPGIIRAGIEARAGEDADDLAEWLADELDEAADLVERGEPANMVIVDS